MSRRCNVCGKEFDVWDENNHFSISEEPAYGSTFDGCGIHINMCCDCFDELVVQMKSKCKIDFIFDKDE